ncbi:MAG: carboxypeptidase regulatory-like domain-containing protein, partial [Saprospiraceae bacterium]|nr:carboxypeptidase regulatory-like domain-containing protein [Saprospiraceae bacterium]
MKKYLPSYTYLQESRHNHKLSISTQTNKHFGMRLFLTTLALFGASLFGSLALANSDEALTCSCPDNLLINPSFEGSTLGWLSSGGNLYYGSGFQVCGHNNGFLQATTSNAWFWQQVNSISVGTQIDLNFWAGTHRPSYNHFIRVAFYNSSGNYISGESRQIDHDVDAGGTLKYYSISTVAPSGSAYLRVEGYANGDYIKIDQVCLTKTECDIHLTCEKNINNTGWSNDGDCSIEVCEGDHVRLSVNPNGLASYEWEGPDGFSMTSSSSDVSIASSFDLADAGIYSVTATDSDGCTATTAIEVGLNNGCLPSGCTTRVVSNTSGCLQPSHYGFWLEGTPYSFENGATFEEFPDGTAVLLGKVNATNGSGKWFDVYAVFTGRTSSIPLGSPKLPGCYTANTSNWYYYTGIAGYIDGSEGAFNINKRGEPFQVGKGANLNENVLGASGWFDANGLKGDFNIRLNGNEGDPCVCNNVTSGGTIGVSQEGCANPTFDPDNIINKTAPSGGTGAIEYIWIKSTTSCVPPASLDDPNWSIIAGANSHSYNPGPLSETTCFIRCSRREGCDDYIGESNVVTVTVLENCLDEPDDEIFACGDGKKIEVYGVGDKCEPTSSISIPGTEFQNVVEITYMTNSQGDYITIDIDGTDYQLPEVESSGIYVYRGLIPGNANTITHHTTNACKYQSMVVYAFRNTTENLSPSMQFTDGFKAFNNIKTFSIPLATDSGPRDVTVKLPISEMTNDGRYLLAKAEAGGVEAQTIIYGPDLSLGSCCLNIVMLTLNDVPGSATSVNFTIDTRNRENGQSVNGQSYIIAGGVSTTSECFECDAVIDKLAFYDTDAGTLGTTIVNGGTYNSSELPLNFNIEAVVSGTSGSSVVFTDVSGNMVGDHIENTAPYRYKLNDTPLGLGAGTYTIKAKVFTQDDGGGVGCDEVTLTFTIVCDLAVNAGGDEEICEGESVILTASVSNEAGNVTYLWNTGATSASITVDPSSTTTYTVNVTDGRGCQDSDDVKVVVNDRPQANLAAEDASCGSSDGSITISFSDHPTRTNIEFSLDGGSTYLASVLDNSGSVTYNNLAPATYQVWARWGDDDCPTSIGSVTIGEDPEPTAIINGGGSICSGEPLAFSAVDQGAGVSYSWDFGANASPATASGIGPHTVTYTLPNGQVGNGSATVKLTVTKASCSDLSEAPIVVFDIPEALVDGGDPTCGDNNGSITFTYPDNPNRTSISFSINGGASFPYTVTDNTGSFTVDDLAEGSYDLAARWGDEACATDLGSITLTNQDGPSLSVSDDVAICLGESTTLTAEANGGTGDLTITWSTGSNAGSITVSPNETTTYSVTVEDENGCKSTKEVTVTVNPVPTVSLPNDQSICDGQVVELTASASGGMGDYQYNWSNGETTATISVTPSVTTTYTVEVTDENGCKGTASVTITVDESFCASLGDYVWEDTNGNGIQDDGDTGVEDVTVNLKDEDGNVIETTTTAADGSYSFDNLIPGTYSVQFELHGGFVNSPLDAGGNDALDSDADPAMNGMTATTDLENGETDNTLDA